MTNDTPPQAEFVVSARYDAANSHFLSDQILVNGDCIAFADQPWTDKIVAALLAAAPPQAIERSAGEVANLEAQRQTIEACARIADQFAGSKPARFTTGIERRASPEQQADNCINAMKVRSTEIASAIRGLRPNAALASRSTMVERKREQIARIIFDASPDRFMRVSQCYPAANAILALI